MICSTVAVQMNDLDYCVDSQVALDRGDKFVDAVVTPINGAFVNDVPVPPGGRSALRDGDPLYLACDLIAIVTRDWPVVQ
jgi:hypothetical protein